METEDTFIVDAVRTPIGRYGGALSEIRPDDLAAVSIRGLLERHHGFDPAQVDDVIFGNANGAGEDNRDVARMATLLAGLPTSVPGATVNRLCGSGMEAVIAATRAVAVGDATIALAGGVESMSRSPWVMLKPEVGFPREHSTLWSTTLGWRMVNPKMPSEWTVSLGEGAEILADKYQITRESQDLFAQSSHHRAAAAWDHGDFNAEIVNVPGVSLERDESIRDETTIEKLAKLKPIFRKDGSVTAGNASPMNDGSSAMLLANERSVERFNFEPLARIAACAVSGVDPHLYGIGPIEAAERALTRAGLTWKDISTVELNEAFAAQSLACLAEWPALDPSLVNPSGGALALGHPLGCSGARILTTLAWRLHRSGDRWGLAAMCIGVGQGIAVILEGTR
ncbi:MAG: thiolase family protein [Acidimicrobiales bacterium]